MSGSGANGFVRLPAMSRRTAAPHSIGTSLSTTFTSASGRWRSAPHTRQGRFRNVPLRFSNQSQAGTGTSKRQLRGRAAGSAEIRCHSSKRERRQPTVTTTPTTAGDCGCPTCRTTGRLLAGAAAEHRNDMHKASIRSVRGDGRETARRGHGSVERSRPPHGLRARRNGGALPHSEPDISDRRGTVCTGSVQVCPRCVGLLDHIPVAAGGEGQRHRRVGYGVLPARPE
jgi:hypothetical protein